MVPTVGAHPHQWPVLKSRGAGSGQYPRGFAIDFGVPPDFVKVDGDLYWEA
jgi:hypothetical protein